LLDRSYPFFDCYLIGVLHLIEIQSVIWHSRPPRLAL
jgi:hypothetical protein